ncbi:MAG: mechanosensitive ion channel [Syntrophomonadaceae bacterium]|nr:mechanosensitive ion channel [Syntrophomonadaceae bacterium]
MLGIVDLGESTVLIRIVAHTQPFEQWGVERELRKRIKQTFDREGIRFP